MLFQEYPKRVLVVGGTSRIFEGIRDKAIQSDYQVYGTSRGSTELTDRNFLRLDLANRESVDDFGVQLGEMKFQRILVLTGELSAHFSEEFGSFGISKYYETHLVNTISVIESLIERLTEPGNLIYISSIAALRSSYDYHYSAVKAGVSAYIKSRSRFLHANQSMFSLAPSLLIGTRMYDDMSAETKASHLVRNHGRISSIEELNSFIWSLEPTSTTILNGQTVPVGNDY
jgi:NAD(P)-dependent dehydrogenase (short-subunit alcohol dehydrogenase family)